MQETRVRSLGWEDPLEEEMATPSSILVWKIPWTREPGGLWSVGCKESDTTKWLNTHTQDPTIQGPGGAYTPPEMRMRLGPGKVRPGHSDIIVFFFPGSAVSELLLPLVAWEDWLPPAFQAIWRETWLQRWPNVDIVITTSVIVGGQEILRGIRGKGTGAL